MQADPQNCEGEPEWVEHTDNIILGRTPGDRVVYVCTVGVKFHDGTTSRSVVCQTDGTWEKLQDYPRCKNHLSVTYIHTVLVSRCGDWSIVRNILCRHTALQMHPGVSTVVSSIFVRSRKIRLCDLFKHQMQFAGLSAFYFVHRCELHGVWYRRKPSS